MTVERRHEAESKDLLVVIALGLLSVIGLRTKILGLDVAEASLEEIVSSARDQRLLFYYLLEDALPLLILTRRTGARFGREFVSVCGDTWLGRIILAMLLQLGRRALRFRFSHPALSIKDLKALVQEPAPLTIAADGLGPYGRVHPRLLRLVQARNAIAVPIAVRADRAFHSRRITIPLPRDRLAIVIGSPVMAKALDQPVTPEDLDQSLREARIASLRLLAGAGPQG
jgi:hypothetical protein